MGDCAEEKLWQMRRALIAIAQCYREDVREAARHHGDSQVPVATYGWQRTIDLIEQVLAGDEPDILAKTGRPPERSHEFCPPGESRVEWYFQRWAAEQKGQRDGTK